MRLMISRLSVLCLMFATLASFTSQARCHAEVAPHAVAEAETGTSDASVGHEPSASHEPPPILQFDVGSAVVNIAIFLGMLAILSKFVWPPILEGLKAREEKIHNDLVNAERINSEAKLMLGEYQTKLDMAAGQVQTMLAEARRDAEANSQRILAEAKAEADRNRERAIADIDTAKKVALTELASQTSEIAMSVARQVVGRELRAEDHADLIRQSLDRLPSNN